VYQVNNLADKDEEKIPRMRIRLNRVQKFLEYLQQQERNERDHFGLDMLQGPLSTAFMSRSLAVFAKDRDYIERRLSAGQRGGVFEEAEEAEAPDMNLDVEIARIARERRGLSY
jgi:hypothetical protein